MILEIAKTHKTFFKCLLTALSTEEVENRLYVLFFIQASVVTKSKEEIAGINHRSYVLHNLLLRTDKDGGGEVNTCTCTVETAFSINHCLQKEDRG